MSLFMPEVLRRKRNGERLQPDEIRELIRRYTLDQVPDYQMSALLMAILFQGLDDDELAAWTEAMLHSGDVLDLAKMPGAKVDKHSTGGVGDKISLCLAPAVAALGVKVPMISGRGLGHTGGTLDKLESIPGFNVNLEIDQATELLERLGLFLIGQTEALAPADRRLYSLRDVTGTVESIPLIASSIMSKKLAEGIDALVLDVKVGTGAFMNQIEEARQLARTMIDIGSGAGKRVSALLTNMNAPIGEAVGNALEVKEAIRIMQGTGPKDTLELTLVLGAEMLLKGGAASTLEQGRAAMEMVLNNGRALATFKQIIEAQGGDPAVCDDLTRLQSAAHQTPVIADGDGYISQIHPRKVAQAAIEVGAGRRVKEDIIDPSTGVMLKVKVGDPIQKGQPLAVLHHNDDGKDAALAQLGAAFFISGSKPDKARLIIERM